jgi:NTP pyrophosphatase (non-canonical NTP hydrolase)
MNDMQLGLKLAEEVGELSEVLLKDNGFLPHKEVKEDAFHEIADIINVCIGILAQSGGCKNMSPSDIIDALIAAIETKTKKYASIVTPEPSFNGIPDAMAELVAYVDQIVGQACAINVYGDGRCEIDIPKVNTQLEYEFDNVNEMITKLTEQFNG